MPTLCTDIDRLIPTYLDGELSDSDAHEFEVHTTDCESCKVELAQERAFLDKLRDSLAGPAAPDTLRARLSNKLDAVDAEHARSERRARLSWALPGVASVAAVASLVLLVAFGLSGEPKNDSAVASAEPKAERVDDANPAPAPVIGAQPASMSAAAVSRSVREYLRVPVSTPSFERSTVKLRRWQRSSLWGRKAASFVFDVRRGGESSQLLVTTCDAKGLTFSGKRRIVDGGELFVRDGFGQSEVAFRTKRGIGYIFRSDMAPSELVSLVRQSGLLQR